MQSLVMINSDYYKASCRLLLYYKASCMLLLL